MGDSKVFTLGACHSVLADKHPLLQEAFPNPPLFPACFRMASWAAVGPCPLSARGSSVRRARWLTVPDSCWMGCIRDGQTDLEGGLYPAPSPLRPRSDQTGTLFILDPTRCTATLQDGRPRGAGSGQGSDGAGEGLFGEENCPPSSIFWTADPDEGDRPVREARGLEGARGLHQGRVQLGRNLMGRDARGGLGCHRPGRPGWKGSATWPTRTDTSSGT